MVAVAGRVAPTASYRQRISEKTRAIEWTDAWGMYRAQMADYGIRVEFGTPLETWEVELTEGDES